MSGPKRWDKHLHINIDRWNPLVEFFTDNVPKVPEMIYQPISIQQWKGAIRRKKAKAAVGPDGLVQMGFAHITR